jgi:hypothetical protein
MKNQTRISTEVFLYSLIFVLAAALRFTLLGKVPLVESEASWAYQAWQIWRGELIRPGSLVSYLSITKGLFFIFGSSDYAARVLPAAAGSLAIWIPYFMRGQFGRIPALVLAFGFAIDPALVSVSRIAGGPIPALIFLLLAVAAFHQTNLKWSLVFLVLGLFSGPAFWMGAAILGITLTLSRVFGFWERKEYFQTRFAGFTNNQDSNLQAAGEYFLPLLVLFTVGSFFFSQLEGLSAWTGSLPEFLRGWISPSGVSPLKLLIALIVSNPFSIIFGTLGFLNAWRKNDLVGKIISLWFGISILLVALYPGRQTVDLIWVVVPLWAGAAKESVRILQKVKSFWVTNILSGITVVLFTLNWLTFTGMIFQLGNQQSILLQWGLIAASLALGLLAMAIVASEWNWPTAVKGLVVGVIGVLGFYLFSATVQGAYLKAGDPRSLWTNGPGAGQVNLLLDSIAEVGIAETGRADSIQGAVINGDSTLKWILRDNPGIEFIEVYDPDLIPPILITNEIDNVQVPEAAYRGQDFVIAVNPGWTGILPEDWISWIAFRSGPIENEDIIFWVRNDILSAE